MMSIGENPNRWSRGDCDWRWTFESQLTGRSNHKSTLANWKTSFESWLKIELNQSLRASLIPTCALTLKGKSLNQFGPVFRLHLFPLQLTCLLRFASSNELAPL